MDKHPEDSMTQYGIIIGYTIIFVLAAYGWVAGASTISVLKFLAATTAPLIVVLVMSYL